MHYIIVFAIFGLISWLMGLTIGVLSTMFYLIGVGILFGAMYLFERREATFYKALTVSNMCYILLIVVGMAFGIAMAMGIKFPGGLSLGFIQQNLRFAAITGLLDFVLFFGLQIFLLTHYIYVSAGRAVLITLTHIAGHIALAVVLALVIMLLPASTVEAGVTWLKGRIVQEQPEWVSEGVLRSEGSGNRSSSSQGDMSDEERQRRAAELRYNRQQQDAAQMERLRQQQEAARELDRQRRQEAAQR